MFDATVNCVCPLPVPLAPDVIVIQGVLVVAVHRHVLCVVTVIAPLPPAAGVANDVGFTEYVQGVTVTVAVLLSALPHVLNTRTQ